MNTLKFWLVTALIFGVYGAGLAAVFGLNYILIRAILG